MQPIPLWQEAVPNRDSHWVYNTLGGVLARDQFTMCLLTGLNKVALKPVNYDKLLDIIQDRRENLSQFLQCLGKALLHYTNLDPERPDGRQLFMTHLFSQSFLNIRTKLKHLDRDSLTLQAEVLGMTFKVYHGRDDKACKKLQNADQGDCQAPLTPGAQGPLGPYFKCGQNGHCAWVCPNPHIGTPGPCSKCHHEGHWPIDCLCAPGGMERSKADHPSATLLGLTINN